jgi:hypothetical protein
MVKIRIVVQENHPRQKKQQYPYIFIAQNLNQDLSLCGFVI